VSEHFIAGGFLSKGDLVFEVERVDYELALENARAARAKAELELARQQSNARVARAEWERLDIAGEEAPNPLVLYEPQLNQAHAALASADTAIRKAELDLERTSISAPFNCRVRSEQAEPGQYVRAGVSVGTVAGSNIADVVVPLPLEEVSLLDVPRQGGKRKGSTGEVILETGNGRFSWEGRVDRTLGEVDPKGLMTRVVVEVGDPYNLVAEAGDRRPDLEVGMFVAVLLEGGVMENVFVIPRNALRDGETVWIVEADETLGIRDVHVLRRDEERVMVDSGLDNGEKVIVSSLEGAAEGMKVRTVEEGAGR
jgi:RND family efflux transporter MFP subunit